MTAEGNTNPVIAEAYRWVEMPKLIEQYRALMKEHGNEFTIFAYASTIFNPAGYKPKRIDHHVVVEGRQVTMGVYAVGPYEFRGTVRKQKDGAIIHTVGVYPTLVDGGRAVGANIIVEDSAAALAYMYEREFGKPPAGISFEEMAEGDMEKIGHRLSAAGESHLYKLQIINVQTEKGIIPALAVCVNERSRFSALGENMETIADAVVEGHGEERDNGQPGKKFGGSCLQEFMKLMSLYRRDKYTQPKMEELSALVCQRTEEKHLRVQLRDMPKLCSNIEELLLREVENKTFASQIKPRTFNVGEQMADRGEVPADRLVKTSIPITPAEKKKWLSEVVTSEAFHGFKASLAK